jgi:hypothetical protein
MSESPFRFVHFSMAAVGCARLSTALQAAVQAFPSMDAVWSTASDVSVGVFTASELLNSHARSLPGWTDTETRYLIVADVPEPALLKLPTILRVHKPDQRIHVARDPGVVKRQVIALRRDRAFEGIIDAYLVGRQLFAVLGDMSIRCFPVDRVQGLSNLDAGALGEFEIHESGSYLCWPAEDLRLGASQLLQAVDPMFLADIQIERYARQKTSLALRVIRERRGFRQSDFKGLSDRHVRRLENEESPLTAETAQKYATAFGMSLESFLGELAEYLRKSSDLPDGVDGVPDAGS